MNDLGDFRVPKPDPKHFAPEISIEVHLLRERCAQYMKSFPKFPYSRMVWVGKDLKDYLAGTPLPQTETSSTRQDCSKCHPAQP